MLRALALTCLVVGVSACGPSGPDRASLEAVVGADLSEPARLGGPLDSWRAVLDQPLPQSFSEPAEGEYWWVHTFAADPAYRPPPSSPLRCRRGAETEWGASPPLLCEGAQGPWRYVAEVWPETGTGRFVAVLPSE